MIKFLALFPLLIFCRVQTPEDIEKSSFYKHHVAEEKGAIPKQLHVIWLGSSPFPKDSQKFLKGWAQKHPGWGATFWTDQKRPDFCETFKQHLVQEGDLPHFYSEYLSSDNEAEKAALLRLEILDQYGGVVFDHDVSCQKSFEDLHQKFDFYAPLKEYDTPILSSSIQVMPFILAAKPSHLIIQKTIEKTKATWGQIGEYFPGADLESILYRVQYRTQKPLDDMTYQYLAKNDKVFLPKNFLYAKHLHMRSYLNDPDAFKKKLSSHLKELEKQQKWILWLVIAVIGLNLIFLNIRWLSRLRS
ncbi:MAG: glycosyltransferase [Simkaniaceae bacterium]